MPPVTPRRRFIARANRQLPATHPATAPAPAKAQAKHHPTPHEPEEKTKTSSNANRIRLTRFKPGFEEDTEKELARIFCRPPRTYKEDPPFYPWVPITPIVNFHLNYKG